MLAYIGSSLLYRSALGSLVHNDLPCLTYVPTIYENTCSDQTLVAIQDKVLRCNEEGQK